MTLRRTSLVRDFQAGQRTSSSVLSMNVSSDNKVWCGRVFWLGKEEGWGGDIGTRIDEAGLVKDCMWFWGGELSGCSFWVGSGVGWLVRIAG